MSLEDHRLILVSNAEPYAHSLDGEEIVCEKLAGGLTSALDPLMQEISGVWIAWGRGEIDFEVLDSKRMVKVPDEEGYDLKRLELSEEEVEGFYFDFSNRVLWPICHSLPGRAILGEYNLCEKTWNIYRKVNLKYAEAIMEELEDDDLIWVHDYHLSLVPKIIRKNYPKANIAFFWHIPWSPWENFGNIPWRKEIMKGLLASDFIGFHTSESVKNFLSCAERIGEEVEWGKSSVKSDGDTTKITAEPLGIDFDWFSSLAKEEVIRKDAQRLRDGVPARKIILSIDRLDYTKGIPERLKAFELFLEENPEFLGEVTLVQRVTPSRTSVDEYQSILNEINRIIGKINGKFGRAEWSPVKSFHRFLPKQEQLIPYYMAADVALVTPLIDGMNLVCKEYIASTDNGVLILSEFAGAADELEEAIHVNPYNTREVARGIREALTMPNSEKKDRLRKLKKRVKEKDLERWRKKFINGWLKTCKEERA